jgi:hypothetical protein
MNWVQQINLEEESISNMISKVWHSFDKRDVANVSGFAIVGIPAIRRGKRMIDRGAKAVNVCIY